MDLIKKIKYRWFITRVELHTTYYVKKFKNELRITIDGNVLYQGKQYDENSENRRYIDINGDEDRELRKLIYSILIREGLV